MLIGRDGELNRAAARVGAATRGHGGLLLVSGEPGVGKSTLVTAAAAGAAAHGVGVRWGRCRETEGAPAFWPWTQVLDGTPRTDPVLDPLWSGETAAGGDRFRLFDAATRALTGLGTGEPLLVVLDDFHRADEASLALLRFVVPVLGRSCVVVIGTYRPAEVSAGHPLALLLEETAGDPALESLELSGLSVDDTAALVREWGVDLDAADLHERTGGNPFFLTELARIGDGGRLPATVEAAIRARVGPLPEAGLLRTASVLGRDLDPAELAHLCGHDEEEVEAALEKGIEAGLLVPGPQGGVRFRHVLVQEALHAGLPATERARLHERVLDVLDPTDPATPARLAHHALCAVGRPGGRARAGRMVLSAARDATARLAHSQATDLYTRALALQPADRTEVLLALGRVAGRAGRTDEARRAYDEAWASASGTRHRVRAALGLGEVIVSAGRVDAELMRMLEATVHLLAADAHTDRVRLTARLATEMYWGEGLHRARALAAEAETMARAVGDPGALAAALAARQFVLRGPDGLDARLRLGRELARLGHRLDDDELELGARRLLVPDALQSDPRAAQVELDALDDLAHRSRRPLARWYLLLHRTTWAIMTGLPSAGQLVDATLELGHRIDAQPAPVYNVAHRLMLRGAVPDPALLADQRRAAAGYPVLATLRCQLALVLAEADRPTEAQALLDELLDDGGAALPRDSLWLASIVVLAEAAHRMEHAAHARTVLDLLEPYSGRVAVLGLTVWVGAVDRGLALAATVVGRWDDAERWFDSALRTHEAWGAWPLVSRTMAEHAAMLRRRGRVGDRPRAARLAAHATAQAGGTPAVAGGLTVREREVVGRLAQGASNREIAAALHLSVHTVERHLANAYAKIGARNRAEATAWVLRSD